MPSESELRRILREGAGDPNVLDPALIIRKARARRRPKQFVIGAAGALATAALVLPVALGTGSGTPNIAASDERAEIGGTEGDVSMSEQDRSIPAEEQDATPAEHALLCGAPAIHYASLDGITLTLTGPTGGGGTGPLRADATLRNMGDEHFTGTADAYLSVALVRDGVVVATSSTGIEHEQVPLDLAPRASQLMRVDILLVGCDQDEGEPRGALALGEYRLTAAIDVTTADGETARVGAVPTAFTLHPN